MSFLVLYLVRNVQLQKMQSTVAQVHDVVHNLECVLSMLGRVPTMVVIGLNYL